MNKTTKIILISTGVLALGTLIYFVVRRMNKKSEVKSMEDRIKKIKNSKTPSTFPNKASTTSNTGSNSTSSSNTTTLDKMPVKPVSIITSSITPVFIGNSSPNPVTEQPNLTSSTFIKLDNKIKKLYYILAPLDKKDGIVIYVPADGFTPEFPNQPVSDNMKNTLWRVAYNDYKDLVKGFNSEESNQATKSYGNQLLNIFKTQRLDYLFDPKVYNENKDWYKDAEARSIKANVKTDFWKVT